MHEQSTLAKNKNSNLLAVFPIEVRFCGANQQLNHQTFEIEALFGLLTMW